MRDFKIASKKDICSHKFALINPACRVTPPPHPPQSCWNYIYMYVYESGAACEKMYPCCQYCGYGSGGGSGYQQFTILILLIETYTTLEQRSGGSVYTMRLILIYCGRRTTVLRLFGFISLSLFISVVRSRSGKFI